ncbi:hypothetical protein H074_31482 [Amycolatopsis decaplanina DSM 44594]|uniref:PE domain-containing protein n=1 Tax=Amycolatopsis decaplanina DSM 44594 TaxID=1284240 RepID=M2XUM8_9PSEU|nr:hypothetical protein H074_31482 [Amycolatopsis decaplanina DSM 44594]
MAGVDVAIVEQGRDYERTVDHGAASLAAGAAAGGYTLDPVEARDMLKQAAHELDRLYALKHHAETLKSVQPPASDPASRTYNARLVNGANGAFEHGLAQIDKEIAYLEQLKAKIKEAFAKINGREATAEDEIRRVGGQSLTPTSQSGTTGYF